MLENDSFSLICFKVMHSFLKEDSRQEQTTSLENSRSYNSRSNGGVMCETSYDQAQTG